MTAPVIRCRSSRHRADPGQACSSMGKTGEARRVQETSMRYLCVVICMNSAEPGVDDPVPGSAEFIQMLSDYQATTQAMAAGAVLVNSGPLQARRGFVRPRRLRGRPRVSFGPGVPCSLVVAAGFHPIAADCHRAPSGGVAFGAVDEEQMAFVVAHGRSRPGSAWPRCPR